LNGTSFTMDVVVPPGTTAEVSLPDDGDTVEIGSGRHAFSTTMVTPRPVEKPQPFWTPE